MHPEIKKELHKLARFRKFLNFYDWISKWLFGPPTIIALIALVASAVFPPLFPFLLPIIIPTGLIAIGSIILNAFILKDPDARYRKQFYQKLFPAIVQTAYESFRFQKDTSSFKTNLKASSIIGMKFESLNCRALLKGKIDQNDVAISRLYADKEVFDLKTLGASALLEIPSLMLDGESMLDGSKYIPVFNGIMIEANIAKTFPSVVIVAPQAKWKLFKDAYTYRSKEITSSNVIFNDRYIVWAEDVSIGERWLNNDVTNVINGFSDEFGCELFVSISKSKVFLGYEPQNIVFDCDPEKPLPTEEDIELFFSRFNYVLNAISVFQHTKQD